LRPELLQGLLRNQPPLLEWDGFCLQLAFSAQSSHVAVRDTKGFSDFLRAKPFHSQHFTSLDRSPDTVYNCSVRNNYRPYRENGQVM